MGPAKSGTSSLWKSLSQLGTFKYYKFKESNVLINKDASIEHYSNFTGSGCLLDASPEYYANLEIVLPKIKSVFVENNYEVFIVISVRNRLERWRSHILHDLFHGTIELEQLRNLETIDISRLNYYKRHDITENKLNLLRKSGFKFGIVNTESLFTDMRELLGAWGFKDSDLLIESTDNEARSFKYKLLRRLDADPPEFIRIIRRCFFSEHLSRGFRRRIRRLNTKQVEVSIDDADLKNLLEMVDK